MVLPVKLGFAAGIFFEKISNTNTAGLKFQKLRTEFKDWRN